MIWSRTSSRVVSLTRAFVCAAIVLVTVLVAPWAEATVVECVSVSGSGVQARAESGSPSTSADGRYVAFVSAADNLVSGDTNGAYDVFVYDRDTGSVRRVSISSSGLEANGDSRAPAMSADGQCVVFLSSATNLVSGDTNGKWDAFAYTLSTGAIERVSVATDGAGSDGDCTRVCVDGDGSLVCFTSDATDLVEGDSNEAADVFVRDRDAGVTRRVSVASDGSQGDRRSDYVSVSDDGRYIAFDSIADNLVSEDTNGKWDVFVHDCETRNTTRVSVSSSGTQATGDSICPSMSGDGTCVGFESEADDLVPTDGDHKWDVFVRDLSEETTERVSLSSGDSQNDGDSDSASVSDDGRYVAFTSLATNLVVGDTNGMRDVFVYDRESGFTQRVSVSSAGTQTYDDSDSPKISATGSVVAFESWAEELVDSDSNLCADIFVAELDDSSSDGDETSDSTTTTTTEGSSDGEPSPSEDLTNEGATEPSVAASTLLTSSLYQQTDSRIFYQGPWYNSRLRTLKWANGTGAVATITFQGTGINFYATTKSRYGIAAMSLDGGAPVDVDFYSSYDKRCQMLYSAQGLENKTHTLTITWQPKRNAASTGTYIDIDFLIVTGTLVETPRPPTPSLYQQTDSRIYYQGPWFNSILRTLMWANGSGAVATITFQGTGIDFYATTKSRYGIAAMSLDGGAPVDVDFYSSYDKRCQMLYSAQGLDNKTHTLTITWQPKRNAASTGTYIDIDFLIVNGTLVETPIPTRYEQSDSRITYLGHWLSGGLGTFAWANEPGAAVLISFKGTVVDLYAKKAPRYGVAEVSIDDGTPTLVDFYASADISDQLVYHKGGLSEGTHTLALRYTGARNPASSNGIVDIDGVVIQGTLVQAPEPVRHEQGSTEFNYAGSWVTSSSGLPSAGTFAYANSTGASASIQFEGDYIAWIAKTGPMYGRARVSLDGGQPFYVDLYSSESLYQQKVYDSGMLQDGIHTLTIQWTSFKNALSDNYYINIDAVEIMGSLVKTSQVPESYAVHQQSDTRLTYGGSWQTAVQSEASGGSFAYGGARGALVCVNFTGTGLELIGKKAPQYGKAIVSLDGQESKYVDFYSPSVEYQELIYATGRLAYGEHTLTIEWAGVKDPASLGYLIGIDALAISGTLTQAPEPTWYEESADALVYSGLWTNVDTLSAHGGVYYSTDSPGASLLVEFEGTHLEWFAKTSASYGQALVSLDGAPASEVDLYSPDTLYRQCVYSTGTLLAGTHTISISWSGSKNVASTGSEIGIDYLFLDGSLTAVQPARLTGERRPFALVGSDKTRVTFTLSGPPTSVQTDLSTGADLAVVFTGAQGPTLPLEIGSTGVHSVTTTLLGSGGQAMSLDLARYQRYRVMSLAASANVAPRIVVDTYHRDDGPPGDGPPLVYLDPGHGGSASGTIGVVSNVPEKTANLAVCLLARQYIADRGLGVELTRYADVDVALDQRCILANNAGATIFLSVHCNAAYDQSVGGTETFYQEKTPEYTAKAIALATAVQDRVLAALGLRDRGVRTWWGTLAVLNGTTMPAALVELGFMSNPTEDILLTSSAGREKAAKAIADAAVDYLGWSTEVFTSE